MALPAALDDVRLRVKPVEQDRLLVLALGPDGVDEVKGATPVEPGLRQPVERLRAADDDSVTSTRRHPIQAPGVGEGGDHQVTAPLEVGACSDPGDAEGVEQDLLDVGWDFPLQPGRLVGELLHTLCSGGGERCDRATGQRADESAEGLTPGCAARRHLTVEPQGDVP